MMSTVIFMLFLFPQINCLISNPALALLSPLNIYVAQIRELNSSNDHFHLIYHHTDPVYTFHSFTFNDVLQRIYICSASTIYTLDLAFQLSLIPFVSIDDTPCRSSLIYSSNVTSLLWTARNTIIQFDFQEMSREILWNSTSTILTMIANETMDENYIDFYLSIETIAHQSSILRCRSNRHSRQLSYQSCLFIDRGYQEISALAIEKNLLYVADRLEQQIYVLNLSSNGRILSKKTLPFNRSTIADIQSMLIYNHYLIWLTTSGHMRILSLKTYEVRNLFWFDEQLQSIALVSFSQWPTTSTIPSTSPSEQIETTTIENNLWKTTTYITSMFLGMALFLCAVMMTYVLLNSRVQRMGPNSFTNIYHILHRRTMTIPQSLT